MTSTMSMISNNDDCNTAEDSSSSSSLRSSTTTDSSSSNAAAGGGVGRAPLPSAMKKIKASPSPTSKNVRFGSVFVDSFLIELGVDAVVPSEGPAICLASGLPIQRDVYDCLDVYERQRLPHLRPKPQLWLESSSRFLLLVCSGHDVYDVEAAVRNAACVRTLRRVSIRDRENNYQETNRNRRRRIRSHPSILAVMASTTQRAMKNMKTMRSSLHQKHHDKIPQMPIRGSPVPGCAEHAVRNQQVAMTA